MSNPITTAAFIALTAGSLFAAACNKSDSKTAGKGEKVEMVKCMGVNECKGHGACKTANNACAGQNGCKGQGMTEMTPADCSGKNGTVAKM
jgi:hypothetical protein